MQCLRWLFVLCLVASSASAFAAPAGVDAAVSRAKYIVHVKVIGLERSKNVVEKTGDGKVRYGDDWAVCEVKKIVLGMVATDLQGRVRVTSASTKSTVALDSPVRYKAGDEFTIVADRCAMDNKVGMILPGDAPHYKGAPSKELLTRLDDRIRAAESTRDALSKLLPGAQKEVEKALKEFDEQKRNDFKDLSPEADLIFDSCALAQYTPDLADFPRPELGIEQRAKLTRLAWRGVCGLDGDSAEIAAGLALAKGNGAPQLLRPAAIDDSKALEALRRLAARKQLAPALDWLCRHDVKGRALKWASQLATGDDDASQAAEWALIQSGEEGYLDVKDVRKALAPNGDALAVALGKKAERLAGWLLLCRPQGEPSAKVQATEELSTQLRSLYGRVEMLQVYAYALGMRGADEARVKAVREQMKDKVHGQGELDLADFADVARELRYKDKMPAAVKRLVKRNGSMMR